MGLTPADRIVNPAIPVPIPNVFACVGVKAFRTRGRFLVRDIMASNSGS